MSPEDAEATQDLMVATHAESPLALGQVAVGSHATASQRPVQTTAALEQRDATQIHMFHLFGTIAPIPAIGLSLVLGGDPVALHVFWVGAIVLGACNAGLLWLTGRPERFRPRLAIVLWLTSVVSTQPLIYYFGPYSGVVMVSILGVLFVSFGRTRWIALATLWICLVAHAAMAIPIGLKWVADRGMLSSVDVEPFRLMIAEGLMMSLFTAAYAIGRWARRTNAAAANELQSAMRIIGDKEQALAEVKDDAARAKGIDEGRWTGHLMGRFKLGLVLGRGAMGEVYEATAADGAPAAVKLLNARSTASANMVERFHREMEVAAKLESPHIVKVLELSPASSPVPYIAMERLRGTDLATRLRNESRMPSDELVVLLDHVARGLEVARIAGVVHRDLKPHNLFHHESATWKILDFGVSKLAGGEGTLTGDGIVGTPQYMAPEQASGGQVSHLADVYALGAIAYRCLTGRSPFKGEDLAELVYQVVHAPPLRPSVLARVSPAVEEVLAVAMAKDPRRRFPSALEFAQAFVAARSGRVVVLSPPADPWA